MKLPILTPAACRAVLVGAVVISQAREGGSRVVAAQPPARNQIPPAPRPVPLAGNPEMDALRMVKEGRETFRHDTFGDEAFWGDALKLHQAIAGEKLGGVGPGVS